jgi:hypothetical protein
LIIASMRQRKKSVVSIPESPKNQPLLELNSRETTIGAHPEKLVSMRAPGVLQGRLVNKR